MLNLAQATSMILLEKLPSVNPLWMAEAATASMVATLGGAVILKKTADVYCSGMEKT